MNDLEPRLTEAGARLRDTAPTAASTEAALAALGDVRLDDLDTRRSRRWIIGPAVLAAAAAVIGVVVVTRPDEAAIVPADTTTVVTTVPPTSPTPTTPTLTPTPTPTPTSAPEVSPPPSPPAPTTVPGIDLGGGVALTTSNVDFDGAGGACLTLSTATDAAFGCADGATMGSVYGQPLSLRLDGTSYALFPQGVDGAGEPVLTVGDAAFSTCLAAVDLQGRSSRARPAPATASVSSACSRRRRTVL